MSITDELREAIGELRVEWIDLAIMGPKPTREDFTAIADRIDFEHEAACAEAYGNGVMSVPITLDESQWVKLPVDADGEVIHVGDAVTCGATVWTVTGLKFIGEGWGICCTVYNEYGGSGTSVYPPSDLRHHHEPTVKDVLWEFVSEFRDNTELGDEEIIEQFAAKLRLAKEGE